MRIATALLAMAGCAHGDGLAGAPDSGGGADAAPDAAPDAALTRPDGGCAISEGSTLVLDGASDLAKYPSAQHVTLGAMMAADDAAITWDRQTLYLTVQSAAFAGAYEPLHVYLEASTGLGAAVPSQGKEYAGLIPQLAFTPTHLIAVRRTSDSGTGGAYDGVYRPTASWSTRETPLVEGTEVHVSSDGQTLSVAVPWAALGTCPTGVRLAGHVVHGAVANEWKDVAPSTATPWQAPGGGFYEIDVTGAAAVDGWIQR